MYVYEGCLSPLANLVTEKPTVRRKQSADTSSKMLVKRGIFFYRANPDHLPDSAASVGPGFGS